jgi:hypothetical protein
MHPAKVAEVLGLKAGRRESIDVKLIKNGKFEIVLKRVEGEKCTLPVVSNDTRNRQALRRQDALPIFVPLLKKRQKRGFRLLPASPCPLS